MADADADVLRVMVFDAHGRPLFLLPYTSCSWQESVSEAGSLSVEVQYTEAALKVAGGLRSRLAVWGVIVAAVRGSRVVHAGWLTSYAWDADSRRLSLTCGGGWTILQKRLVLNHALDSRWRDGDVLIDEEHPAGAWDLHLTGSYQDIAAGLVGEAMKWGPLPFTLPVREGGSHERHYAGYDLATTADRLEDLAGLADGVELRADPVLLDTGYLVFVLRAQPEIVDHAWTADGLGMWNACVPGQRVRLRGVRADGAGMTSQVYATGGKDADKTIACRGTSLIDGLPLLQSKDTEHTTLSDVGQLREDVRGDLAYGAHPDETITVSVGDEYPVRPGDHADLMVEDDFLGRRLLPLKITDVSGSSDSDWLDVQARERA